MAGWAGDGEQAGGRGPAGTPAHGTWQLQLFGTFWDITPAGILVLRNYELQKPIPDYAE